MKQSLILRLLVSHLYRNKLLIFPGQSWLKKKCKSCFRRWQYIWYCSNYIYWIIPHIIHYFSHTSLSLFLNYLFSRINSLTFQATPYIKIYSTLILQIIFFLELPSHFLLKLPTKNTQFLFRSILVFQTVGKIKSILGNLKHIGFD